MFRNCRTGVALGVLAVLALGSSAVREGREATASFAPHRGLRLVARDQPAYVPPRDPPRQRLAMFTVATMGFTAPAQAALQFAVDVWAGILTSPVPIAIEARFGTLASGVLASASATSLHRGFVGAPLVNSWYPVAVANKLSARDLDPGRPDITVTFSNTATWHFGTDGLPPSGTVDFVTVALHELAHGLGFFGSATVSGTLGTWGSGTGTPDAFDRFVQNSGAQFILNTALFPNPSVALAGQLQGNDLFLGTAATNAAQNQHSLLAPAKLHAPGTFEPGSSYSHLDETTFPTGNSDSLMTPSIAFMEAIHDPGTITREILRELGWTASTGPPALPGDLPSPPTALSAAINGFDVTLTWNTPTAIFAPPGRASATAYQIEAGSATGLANLLERRVANVTSFSATGPAGVYFVAVRGLNPAGTGARSNEIVVTLPGGTPGCTVVPTAPTGLAFAVASRTVTLTWTASPGCPATSYVIEAGSAPGASNLASLDNGSATPTLVVPGVPSGTYFVRVRGRNAAGTGAPSTDITVVVP